MQTFNKVLIETTLPNIGDRWLNLKLPIHEDENKRATITKQVKNVIRSKWHALNLLEELKLEYGELAT